MPVESTTTAAGDLIEVSRLCPRHGVYLNRGTRRCAKGKKLGLQMCVRPLLVAWRDRKRGRTVTNARTRHLVRLLMTAEV